MAKDLNPTLTPVADDILSVLDEPFDYEAAAYTPSDADEFRQSHPYERPVASVDLEKETQANDVYADILDSFLDRDGATGRDVFVKEFADRQLLARMREQNPNPQYLPTSGTSFVREAREAFDLVREHSKNYKNDRTAVVEGRKYSRAVNTMSTTQEQENMLAMYWLRDRLVVLGSSKYAPMESEINSGNMTRELDRRLELRKQAEAKKA